MKSKRSHGEGDLLAWLCRAGGATTAGLGDDVAHLRLPGLCVLSVDTQEEGVHFLAGLDPATIARRLLAVNLSDLAAAGARPRAALLALAAPPTFDHRTFFRALVAACRKHGMALAGGDLARSDRVRAALTVIGQPAGRPLRRSHARPGDRLWLGGNVGESAAGRALLALGCAWRAKRPQLSSRLTTQGSALRRAAGRVLRTHFDPRPQLDLGLWLARQSRIAAIDLSDGLLLDLSRLCRQSGVGATIDIAALPVSPELRKVAAFLHANANEFALRGGEDYVLLFAAPPGMHPPPRFSCHLIGHIEGRKGLRTMLAGKPFRRDADAGLGWDHLAG